ncbi:polyketide synthase dehydratase domain-containing protein, partial [Streptomyces tsukubensis]
GCDAIDELVIETPLVVPVTGVVDLTVTVDRADDATGHRPVTVHARPEGSDAWTRHATGTLTTTTTTTTATAPHTPDTPDLFLQWPPANAHPVDLTAFYDELAAAGYGYGPAFQGLRAAWRAGDTTYAEVALDGAVEVDRFGVHPALLDAALHAGRLDAGDELELPFSWAGVRLHATGATAVRVALTRVPAGVAVHVADPDGRPVVSVDALVLRPRTATSSGPDLLALEWVPLAEADYDGDLPDNYTL